MGPEELQSQTGLGGPSSLLWGVEKSLTDGQVYLFLFDTSLEGTLLTR